MSAWTKFFREVRRLLTERTTLLFMAVTVTEVLWFCLNSPGRTAVDAYILAPAKSSAVLGVLLFTLLTLLQFHRDYKNNTDSIVLTCTDPIFHQLRRTLALICAAVVTTLLIALFALPLALVKTGTYFQAESFAASWYVIFFGALVLSILLSSGFYLLFRRVEAAFLAMTGLILLSVILESQYDLNPCYLLFWVQTNVTNFSDLISNQFQVDLILWNRLFCFLVALGVWFLGLCSLRRYGRGVLGSFVSNCRRVWPPVMLVAMIVFSGVSYAVEPVFDDSIPIDYAAMYSSGTGIMVASMEAEEEPSVWLLTDKTASLDVDTDSRTAWGKATYRLQNLSGEPQTLSLEVNTGYVIKDVFVNGEAAVAVRDAIEEGSCATWYIELPADAESVVELSYGGSVKNDGSISQVVYSGIGDAYIALPSAAFSPRIDVDVSDDCRFSGTLRLNERLTPIFTGVEAEKLGTVEGKTQWHFSIGDGRHNISFTAAEYSTTTFEAGGLRVKFHYFSRQDKAINEMNSIDVMKAAIDYFTDAYGALPYGDHLTILELPASFSGGYAAGDVSAMDETTFAVSGYLPTGDASSQATDGVEVLVHEIAHQWWGLATYPTSDGTNYWSAEGITCYSTYRFFESYYGAEYAKEHFLDKWESNWETYQDAFYIQNPEYLAKLSEEDQYNVLATLNNIGLYDIMPLQILKAEAALGGPEVFQQKLAELYSTYLGSPISFEDFLSVTGLNEEVLDLA